MLLVGHHWVLDVVHVNSGCHFVVVVVVVKGCLDIYSGRLNGTTRSSQCITGYVRLYYNY